MSRARRAAAVLALAALQALATAARATPPPTGPIPATTPTAPSPLERHVFEIKTEQDQWALYDAYRALSRSGRDEQVEVRFAPGAHKVNLSLEMMDAPAAPRIDLVVRGASDGSTVLQSRQLKLVARSVVLEDLVFREGTAGLLEVWATREIALRRCAFLGNRWVSAWQGGRMVSLRGIGEAPLRVSLDEVWLAHNSEAKPSTLLGIECAPQAPIDALEVRGLVLADNAVDRELAVIGARSVRMQGVLAVRTRAGGKLLDLQSCDDVELRDGALSIDHPSQLGTTPARFPGTRVYARGTHGLAPGLALDPAHLSSRHRIEVHHAALAEALRLPTAHLPDAAARDKLARALRP